MMCMHDSDHDGVSQIQIGRAHVDLGSKRSSTVREFPLFHSGKQIQVFFDGTIAIRAVLARFRKRSSVLPHLLSVQIAYERMAFANQLDRPIVQLTKVVRGIQQFVPLKTKPLNVGFDGVDVFFALFGWIRVIKTKIARTTVGFCQAKVQADAFGVSDMQVAVGLRWKACGHALTDQFGLGCHVLFDFDFDKVLVAG